MYIYIWICIYVYTQELKHPYSQSCTLSKPELWEKGFFPDTHELSLSHTRTLVLSLFPMHDLKLKKHSIKTRALEEYFTWRHTHSFTHTLSPSLTHNVKFKRHEVKARIVDEIFWSKETYTHRHTHTQTHTLSLSHTHFLKLKRYRDVGGWGRDPKKCTGRDWGMGSSTI